MTNGTSCNHSFRKRAFAISMRAMFLMVVSCATQMHDPGVDELMRAYHGDVPGASVLVLRDGRALVRASYGMADLEARVPVTPQTNFRLASVTKQFPAAAAQILAERAARA